MAGAGYKLFNTGDVLTAAQVNTYLQEQTVMVFASSAARTSALSGVLAEGMMSYLQDTNAVEVYNGTSWVNVGNAGDITEVQAGVGISIASGTGPIPVITNSSTDLITTAGDILYGTAADTMARLGIGTAGQVLKVNSGATAPEWGAAAAASFNTGYAYNATLEGTTSTSFTDLASVVSTTVTTGTKALVSINSIAMNNSAIAGMVIGFAISGATTVAASAEFSTTGIYFFDSSTKLEVKTGGTFVVTGLTAGSNTFTMKFRRKDGSGTVNFAEKSISVVNLGS